MTPRYFFFLLSVAAVTVACEPEEPLQEIPALSLMELPPGFPDLPFPAENAFTESRWQLGKKLFFDVAMSVDSSISCASCHRPDLAFSDDRAFSPGVAQRAGTRNSPSLANVAYHPYYTREGGVPTLEMQVLVPIQEHNEFDFNIVLLAERLLADSSYSRMAQEAYERDPNAYVITRALACFERSLLSGTSPYDRRQEQPLSPAAQRGATLFFSERTQCSTCHGGFNFTNYEFANNGLYADYPDAGRFRLTANEEDRAVFKVPSLRNIGLTAPYMHDGSLTTLAGVIDHYNNGGAEHPNRSPLLQPLFLTEDEKQDLVAFLHTLTDISFTENPLFKK